jgi:ribosomal protein S18 acetylase RimI-like enzyme
MTRLEVAPCSDDHLEEATRLLTARHARNRAAEPLLSARFEDSPAAREELERAWHADDASGAVAFRGGSMVGYLVGAPRANPVWGDNVWVEAPGHAVEEAEAIRDLYGLAAARWIEEGRTRHSVLVPAHDADLLDAWWRLSFGAQHAHGVREVPERTDVAVPDGYEIREPREDEVEQLIDVDLALPQHQQRSPVFSGAPLWTREESREEWLSTFADSDERILIGAYEGRPVACWAVVPVERSSEHRGLLRPEHSCYLGFASTLPDSRGAGIGVALTDAALAWAAESGYSAMITDWRVTNLLSSRFWPRRGFRETFLRLYRSIP